MHILPQEEEDDCEANGEYGHSPHRTSTINGDVDGKKQSEGTNRSYKKGRKLSRDTNVFRARTPSLAWAANSPTNDFRTVMKRVVRRYIFEHLQAAVAEGG